jgi:hypothetical protein
MTNIHLYLHIGAVITYPRRGIVPNKDTLKNTSNLDYIPPF